MCVLQTNASVSGILKSLHLHQGFCEIENVVVLVVISFVVADITLDLLQEKPRWKTGSKSSLEEIIERTINKYTTHENETLFVYSLDLEISLFFVLLWQQQQNIQKIYQELNNKATNCRWNNLENVVHSLNIINGSYDPDDRRNFHGGASSVRRLVGIVSMSFALCNVRTAFESK